jgi:hypothetical protein
MIQMKMTKITPIIVSLCLTLPSVSMVTYADSNLSKDYIVSEIWSDWWVGKGDNGMIFPEASYKHHILEKWVDDNYGDDDYEWSDVGELRYNFKDYYNDMIENWDFNDDGDGNWTIVTEDTTYRFELTNGKWQMIDSNGNTVDSFMPFSTLEEDEVEVTNDNSNSTHRVKGSLSQKQSVSDSKSDNNTDGKLTDNNSETAVEDVSDESESKTNYLLYGIGGLIVAGLVTIGILLYRNKK